MNRHTISKIIFIIVIVLGVVFAGLTIYGNFIAPKQGQVKAPEVKDAAYEFTFAKSSTLLLASKYETYGTAPGKRIYILKAPYWNGIITVKGLSFFKKDGDITISEEVFGTATIKARKGV